MNNIDTLAVATETASWGGFIADNWVALVVGLLAFIKVIVNLTPTETDNQVFGWIDTLINAVISDRKKPAE
ncbi:MAG: hypothetical protein CBD18_02465 [Opitutales bacterium TMED158]|nr:MAG: hypothetical protein CBD18_02465 [Opitutales bacterium TMED158]|tara:strand:+ start:1075 stop:1287 length:213 start_codon:yes stop_codon:yes gene_type:complete